MSPPLESARLWEPVPGIELFEAQLLHHRFNKHFHAAYTIGLNESGCGTCLHRGETHRHYPGSFNLINPGDVHTGQVASADGWTFRNIYIRPSCIKQALTQVEWHSGGIPTFRDMVLWDVALRSRFYQLFNALSEPTAQLAQQSLLLALLSGLFRVNSDRAATLRPPATETQAIALVREYVETHYAENVSIDDLAQLTNLSPYYLIRCFRRQIGCAPHQYQRHWQLMQVKQALRSPQSLSTIAAEHGFYDQSHLNRAFKQTFGVTPGQYQKDNSVQYDSASIAVVSSIEGTNPVAH
ncbi:MAG: AraC family transcriptional regulator [Cyanobacteria bacterium J06626_18]